MVVKTILEGKVLGWKIGVSRRGIASCLAGIALGGAALAQDLPATPAASTLTTATPPPKW
jgi:hypothetical protein